MMVPKPNNDGVYVVLIHFLAKRLSEVELGNDIDDFRKFDIKKIINKGYKGEKFAPNIIPVLQSYLELQNKGLL